MPISAGMLAHLEQNVTFLCEIWSITSRDGAVAAYTNHTRDLAYGGTTYKAAPVEPADPSRKMGLEPDTVEFTGAFDATITEADVVAGRWNKARIVKQIVCYLDLTLGHALKQVGYAGTFSIKNGVYQIQFQSLSQLLGQQVGDLTSPIDRRRRLDEAGISMAAHTHATTVASVTSRRKFKVSYVQPSADYFRYGLAKWTSGANDDLEMEIKASTTTDGGTRTEVELQLPMRSDIASADAVTLIRGYDGSRDAAKAIDVALVVGLESEPDLPGYGKMLNYPE